MQIAPHMYNAYGRVNHFAHRVIVSN